MRRLVLDLRDARSVWAVPGWAVEEIRAALPDGWELVEVAATADGRGDGGAASDEARDAVHGAEIYVGYGVARELFLAATREPGARLCWAHSAAAGVGASLFDEMRASSVILTNSAGIHGPPIAETVIAMVLYFARGLDFAVSGKVASEWLKAPFESADTPVREVAGLALGIVGLGGIGREIAARAAALGMSVAALRRSAAEAPAGVELLSGPDALRRLLERSHVLVLSVPATPETRGMIGSAELEMLPDGAVLVNVARGSILDEAALVAALRSGRLRGAALDVFEHEPLPPSSPLWALPNVLITPHVAATSRSFWRREVDLVLENLRRYFAREPLVNVVDKQRGY